MSRLIFLVILGLIVACAAPAFAADPLIPLTFDHRVDNASLTILVVLKPDQPFSVTIRQTCEAQFDYNMHGLPTAPAVDAGFARMVPQLSNKVLTATYESQYGSYLLSIGEKTGGTPCYEWVDTMGNPATPPTAALTNPKFNTGGMWKEVVGLKEVHLVIAVTPLEWEIGQDAALSLIPAATRKWTTEPTPQTATVNNVDTTVTKYKVVRDSDGEDVARFTFSTLTHLYAPAKNNGLALGFGLIDNSAEYYFGWSWGLGPRNNRVLNIAAGGVLTPVAMLPRGMKDDALLDTAASLASGDLRSAHRLRPFVAFTATFFRSRQNTTERPQALPE